MTTSVRSSPRIRISAYFRYGHIGFFFFCNWWDLLREVFFSGEIYSGEFFFQGRFFLGRFFPGEIFSGEVFSRGDFFWGDFFQGRFFLGRFFPGEIFSGEVFTGEFFSGRFFPGRFFLLTTPFLGGGQPPLAPPWLRACGRITAIERKPDSLFANFMLISVWVGYEKCWSTSREHANYV